MRRSLRSVGSAVCSPYCVSATESSAKPARRPADQRDEVVLTTEEGILGNLQTKSGPTGIKQVGARNGHRWGIRMNGAVWGDRFRQRLDGHNLADPQHVTVVVDAILASAR